MALTFRAETSPLGDIRSTQTPWPWAHGLIPTWKLCLRAAALDSVAREVSASWALGPEMLRVPEMGRPFQAKGFNPLTCHFVNRGTNGAYITPPVGWVVEPGPEP